jgi:hypothetical protein
VRQAGQAEQPSLMKLPEHEYPVAERLEVHAGKTPYVRFDLNDYSIPHTHVRRTLTVLATHRRSWDRRAQIEQEAHVQALVDHKRGARAHRATDRLTQAVPGAAELLQRAAQRGHNLGSVTAGLSKLLDRYGAQPMQAAAHKRSHQRTRDRSRSQAHRPQGRTMTAAASTTSTNPADLPQFKERAHALRLMGLLAHWDAVQGDPARIAWTGELLAWEEAERARRSLERRLRSAHIGRFKLDGDSLLRRRIRHYAAPDLLLIDEVGYLSYSNRHADLLFELISRRYEHKSTVITTNRAFKEWSEVFPNAACTVSLIDRLVHRCEVVAIEGESYRLKEAKARTELKAAQRRAARPKAGKP